MSKYLLLILGLGLSITGFGQLGFTLSNKATKVTIPIEIHNNLVVVPVILNNQLPLKFIVDTGVRTTILTEKIYSDILHLAYSKKYTLSGAGGEKLIDAYVTNNVTIDLPGVHGKGHAMLVLEKDYLELPKSLGTPVHGILGYELFSRFVIKIDYDQKLMTLMAPQKFRPGRRYSRIPITVEDTKPYCVAELKINDTTSMSAKLLIDTGASHGLFLDTESSPKIIVPAKNVACNLGRGLGGIITGRLGRIKSMRIDGYSIPDMIASFPDPDSYIDTTRTGKITFRNGSIGGEALSRFTVIFDFPNEKVYLKKNTSFKKRAYYNMSGLSVEARGEHLNEFEVTEVRENSAAYKVGIKVGDEILMINGHASVDIDLSAINGFFNAKPGKRLRLQLKRGDLVLEKEFILVSEI
jgi:hypothetical protein